MTAVLRDFLEIPYDELEAMNLEAKAERSATLTRLRYLEDMMHQLGMTTAARTPGRKPRGALTLPNVNMSLILRGVALTLMPWR